MIARGFAWLRSVDGSMRPAAFVLYVLAVPMMSEAGRLVEGPELGRIETRLFSQKSLASQLLNPVSIPGMIQVREAA